MSSNVVPSLPTKGGKPKNKKLVWGVVAGAIVLLVVTGVLLYVYRDKLNKQSTSVKDADATVTDTTKTADTAAAKAAQAEAAANAANTAAEKAADEAAVAEKNNTKDAAAKRAEAERTAIIAAQAAAKAAQTAAEAAEAAEAVKAAEAALKQATDAAAADKAAAGGTQLKLNTINLNQSFVAAPYDSNDSFSYIGLIELGRFTATATKMYVNASYTVALGGGAGADRLMATLQVLDATAGLFKGAERSTLMSGKSYAGSVYKQADVFEIINQVSKAGIKFESTQCSDTRNNPQGIQLLLRDQHATVLLNTELPVVISRVYVVYGILGVATDDIITFNDVQGYVRFYD